MPCDPNHVRCPRGTRISLIHSAPGIEFVADVRAYFITLEWWIIDSMPVTIDHHFLYAVGERLKNCVFEKRLRVRLGAPDAKSQCDFYLAEDPNVAAMRKALDAEKARLVKVQGAINKFGL
ncbi:hypothetical protein V8D89_009296 [Ganoderma adspersum]